MPIKTPARVGGEFLDLRGLVAGGPVLALFRVQSFLPAERDNYDRNTYPVVADVLICSASRKGEVHLGETFKYAPANALRGLTVKASDAGEAPVNAPGDELPYVVQLIDKKGSQPFVGLDPAEGDALAQILSVYADGAGWNAERAAAPAQAVSVPAQAPAPAQEPVAAGVGGGTKPPWER
jgi:hypothetical protein